jgi:hypothetical protein
MPGIVSKHRDSVSVSTISISHADFDRRLLRLVEACVAKIDSDPKLVRDHASEHHPMVGCSFARRMGAIAVAPVA